MASGLIILGEDDDKLRRIYVDVLSAAGFSVLAARDGAATLAMLHKGHVPKVLVLDIAMPRVGGIEACRQAREILGPDIPIIFLTSFDRIEVVQDCMDAGGDDFIVKSEQLEAIVARIKMWAQYSSRADAEQRRQESRENIAVEIQKLPKPPPVVIELTSETDTMVRRMSRFLADARSDAEPDFGRTVDEKLYLLGYVTGVVDYWSNVKLAMKRRFLDYLRSVLRETDILSVSEIQKMLDNFDELATEKSFQAAWKCGQGECVSAERSGPNFVPSGLSDFAHAQTV